MPTARDVIEQLRLVPHPEGGWYRETYRHTPAEGGRGAATAIYYLLEAGDRSHWHRVLDADEIWHWYAGAPLALSISPDGKAVETHRLGNDLVTATPQVLVPAGQWQSAQSLGDKTLGDKKQGDWSLVGCTVAPAFDFAQFEMAPPNWEPGS